MKLPHFSSLVGISLLLTAMIPAAAGEKEAAPPKPKAPPAIAPPGEPEVTPKTPKIPDPTPPLATEQDFVMLALRAGRAEVRLAGLAEKKAARAELRQFASTMVKDHTAINEELKTVADGLKVLLPEVPDKEVEAKYKRLNELSGEKFDIAFLAEIATGHTDDATIYEGGRKIAKSKEVIAFIDKTLPTLKRHIDMTAELTKKSAP
ncbi:MAG TPA: DUF4142 domain-containing protein [Verrucomicrobiales bacterium]|nr:DUF4142 domain-containing protein [Verrucomicrobiales bacterium]